MKIYINKNTGVVTSSPAATSSNPAALQNLNGVLGSTLLLDTVFTDDTGAPVDLDSAATGVFVAKQDKHYTDGALVEALAWTKNVATEDGYRLVIVPNDTDLVTLLANLASVILMAEIAWSELGITRKTPKFNFTVENAVWRGDEPVLDNPDVTWPLPGDLALASDLEVKEDALGNPDTNGKVLASTTAGTRSWVTLPTGGGGSGGAVDYELKSAAFTAVAGHAYAVDTTTGPVTITLPTAPTGGSPIAFADARGTWNAHAATFSSGSKIEGQMISYEDAAQGTSLVMVYIDVTTGWRILEAGTKPHNLTVPILAGNSVGAAITTTPGLWTGSPYSYLYQWQTSTDGTTWTDISGATAATYTPVTGDLGHYLRVEVTAINSNGSSLPALSAASAAITAPAFPAGAIGAWHLTADGSDATGNGLDLTNYNSVTFDPTTGAAFDGTSYLQTPSLVSILAGSSFSIAFQAKFDPSAQANGSAGIVTSWLSGGAYNFRVSTDGNLKLYMGGSGEIITAAPTDDAFHFYVIRFNQATTAYDFWVDGVLGASGTSGSITTWVHGLVFGRFDNCLLGNIKEGTLWNRFISPAEIAILAGGALYSA